MKFLLLILLVGLSACSDYQPERPKTGKPYAKVDISSYPTCVFDTDCAPSGERCITLAGPDQAHCFTPAQELASLGCTSGQPILLDMQPWKADCY